MPSLDPQHARGFALRSVQRPEAMVRVLYEDAVLSVILVEMEGGPALKEPLLWGRPSWSFVLEGQATVEQETTRRELLREESLWLTGSVPFSILNQTPGRLRMLTILFETQDGEPGGRP